MEIWLHYSPQEVQAFEFSVDILHILSQAAVDAQQPLVFTPQFNQSCFSSAHGAVPGICKRSATLYACHLDLQYAATTGHGCGKAG